MKIEKLKKKKAISPVISALILTATVLSIGGGIWFYSQGAMTITSEDYAESVINMSDTISERFIIEHVANTSSLLKVWIFNYGNVDIDVKIKVEKDGVIIFPYGSFTPIMAGGFAELDPLSYTATSGDTLVITAFTRRENSVYYRYLVP